MIVRLKGVKKVRAKGRVYYYHRATMTRLPGQPWSHGFVLALQACQGQSSRSPIPGSLGHLCSAYSASPEFASLAPSTQRKYRKVFDELRPLDAMPLVRITPKWLFAYRDKKVVERKRAFTNLILAVLKLMFSWGMRRGIVAVNPVAAVPRVSRPRTAPTINRPWRDEEMEVVLTEAPDWLRVAIVLAAYAGLRSSDVLRVTWNCYDGEVFETRAQKTGVPIWVPAHSRLRAVLDSAPRPSPQIVVGARGRPITRSTLTTTFFNLLKRLREEGKVGPGLSFHGLRHTLGTALAEAGCDPPTIASVLGHSSTAMAEHYSRTANRRELARHAFAKLENRNGKLDKPVP